MSESPKNSPNQATTAATKPPQSPSAKTATSASSTTSPTSTSAKSSSTAATPTSSTAKSTTTTPPPVNSSPKSKGGFLQRLMWRFIFLCIIVGGGGFYANQQPSLKPYVEKVIDFVVAQIPPDSKKDTPERIAKPSISLLRKSQEAQESQGAQKTQISEEQSTQPKNESQYHETLQVTVIQSITGISVNDTLQTSNSPADKIAALESYIINLQNAVARLQIATDDINNRFSQLSSEQTVQINLQLQIIDLKLRQTGDTNAAVEELLSLQNQPQINPHWLASEIIRLQNTVTKNKIVAVLQMLLRDSSAANTTDPVTSNSVGEAFVSIFNVRRAANSSNTDDADIIQRMQLLFLGGQRASYLHALETLASQPPATRNRALQIEILQKYGAPDYSLNLDERQ